jgi:pimeloyl-ACP methyl ester carboxylesterase
MSALIVGDGLVHYEVIGRGRPLVFLHGWLGSWRYWVPAMEDLSAGNRAYALDLWGFGDSDKLAQHYTIDGYVDLLRAFLDHLGIQRVSLVGHALGGLVALQFAAQFPHHVQQIMGVSVPLAAADVGRPLAMISSDADAVSRLVSRRAGFPEVNLEARKADGAAIGSSLRSAMARDLRQMLEVVEQPVLLVYGAGDSLVRPPDDDAGRSGGENVRVLLLDGAQHFPMLETQNKFNRLLVDFLEAGGELDSLSLKDEWRRRLR